MTEHSLSIIIPTWQADTSLARLLAWCQNSLPQAPVIVTDANSNDKTPYIANSYKTILINSDRGRGTQLAHGVKQTKTTWLLILHADSQPSDSFAEAIGHHMATYPGCAGYGRLAFDTDQWRGRLVAWGANKRAAWFGLPYGDQGLLIPRRLYDAVGGYPTWPLMEDVELTRRLRQHYGKTVLRSLRSDIVTDAVRYQQSGYTLRVLRNLGCLIRYYRGEDPTLIAKRYQSRAKPS
ncbi:MAG: TIGR04283 family arsenosugar biosynthesis glycosyltransferase [Pseudomonadota bacterium]